MFLSRYNVENPKDENEIKAEPCPKPAVKAEPCQPPAKEAVAMKVEPNSPPIFAPREASVFTISDEDLLSSHSADVLNVSVDSSLRDEEDDYEEFPPTQLSERGDVLTSLEERHNAYREAAFVAPPSEEGAANNQVFADMPNPFTGAKKPKAVPCKPKAEPGVCYMCDEPIPRKRDTTALQPVSCDACRATYHLRCAKLARVLRHGSWICQSCGMAP